MAASSARPNDREESPPALCCCAFVDRHGRDAHLADASYLDDYLTGAVPGSQLCAQLCADLDDRIRLPMHSGAVYLGVEGVLPLVVLPVLGAAACRSLYAAAALLILVPAALILAHNLAWRRRRRSLLFVSSLCTAVGSTYLAFTLRLAQHVWFGWWLLTTLGLAAAFLSAATLRHPPPATELRRGELWDGLGEERTPLHAREGGEGGSEGGEGGGEGGEGGEGGGEGGEEAAGRDGAVRCALCDTELAGFDHHCVWVDACVASHNHHAFLRGVVSLLVGAAPAGITSAERVQTVPSVELLVAAAAAVAWLLGCALLLAQASSIARGLTGHEARRLRRRGAALPPYGGPWAASARLAHALAGNPAGWRRSCAARGRALSFDVYYFSDTPYSK